MNTLERRAAIEETKMRLSTTRMNHITGNRNLKFVDYTHNEQGRMQTVYRKENGELVYGSNN